MGGYLDSKLENDEHIIYRARAHPFPALFMAVILLAAVLLIKHIPSQLHNFLSSIFDAASLFVGLFLIILASGFLFIQFLLEYYQSDLAVTNQRVMGRQPCMFRLCEFTDYDIPLGQIESAALDRASGLTYDASGSILGLVAVFFGLIFMNPLVYRLIGMGDVLITDKEGTLVRVRRLRRPDQFIEELKRLLPAAAGGHGTAVTASPAFKFNWVIGVGIGLVLVSLLVAGLLIRKFKPAVPRKPPTNRQYDSSQNYEHRLKST